MRGRVIDQKSEPAIGGDKSLAKVFRDFIAELANGVEQASHPRITALGHQSFIDGTLPPSANTREMHSRATGREHG